MIWTLYFSCQFPTNHQADSELKQSRHKLSTLAVACSRDDISMSLLSEKYIILLFFYCNKRNWHHRHRRLKGRELTCECPVIQTYRHFPQYLKEYLTLLDVKFNLWGHIMQGLRSNSSVISRWPQRTRHSSRPFLYAGHWPRDHVPRENGWLDKVMVTQGSTLDCLFKMQVTSHQKFILSALSHALCL